MRKYETVFILDPNLDETQVKDEIGKVRDLILRLEGEVIAVEPAGKKKLTYEIKGHREGHYTLMVFKLKPSSIAEIERSYKLNENVLRHVIVHWVGKKAEGGEEEKAGT